MSTSKIERPTPAGRPGARAAAPPRQPRRGRRPAVRRGQPPRQLRMTVKVSAAAWQRLDARAARAGLALGAWVGLLAEDVALERPAVGEEHLAALAAAGVGVSRIGGAVNELTVGEHIGREAPEAELAAVLTRVAARVGEARAAVAAAAAAVAGGAGGGRTDLAAGARGTGRRTAADSGDGQRDRQVQARITEEEYRLVVVAAGREGLSVGAWLGTLLEDPAAVRPVRGEAWGAVFALRRALRRVATNLAQVAAARVGRGSEAPALLGQVRREVDDAIRACLQLSAQIGGDAGAGAAA